FLALRYPLSADTSAIRKFLAAVFTMAGRNCASLACFPRISTAVTMFVFTPHMICTLTHSWRKRSWPYLWSYQRSNLAVLKPEESQAKSDSTDFNGKLD